MRIKGQVLICISLVFCLVSVVVHADQNKIKAGNITDSQVIIFQGNQFDFGDEQQFKKFMAGLKTYPALIKKFETFFNTRIDTLEANIGKQFKTGREKQDSQFETLKRMLEKNNTSKGLEKQLDKAEADNKKLREKIAELEQQKDQDPEFQNVLEKAKTALAKKQFDQYHKRLEAFSKLKKKKVRAFQKEIAETAALRSEEYEARLDYDAALGQMEEALKYDASNGDHWNRYGKVLHILGRFIEGFLATSRALKIREKVLGAEHPHVAESLNNLAELYRAKGLYEKAEPLYGRSLKILEKVLGAEHPHTKIVRENLESLRGKRSGIRADSFQAE